MAAQTTEPTPDEVEALFSRVDHSGHSSEECARRQRHRRKEKGSPVDVDPLSEDDPSGSNIEKIIARSALIFILSLLILVVAGQVACSVIRRANTGNLARRVDVHTVSAALRGGVEWGNGFTQFPTDARVLEADESTGRVEVMVVDTTSENIMESMAGSMIQSQALAVNALVNPHISQVVYHVSVHVDDNGNQLHSQIFGLIPPSGKTRPLMTFIWTKTSTTTGVSFNLTVAGVSEDIMKDLAQKVGGGQAAPEEENASSEN